MINCFTILENNMDERDVKLQGLTTHKRTMTFVTGYVTCTNCAANYTQNPGEKTFCQKYSRSVDPSDTEKNITTAEACVQWVGDGMDRNKVVHPDHAYAYDRSCD